MAKKRFVPYVDLATEPNIIVDGAGHEHSQLVLSHWPKSGTPRALKRDLSTQSVFAYLEQPEFHVDAEVASNDHFDEDGLVGLYALIHPEEGLAQQALLEDIAAAGDFQRYRDRRAARIAFAIAAFAQPTGSFIDAVLFDGPYERLAGALYETLLDRLSGMLADPDSVRSLWREQDEALSISEGHIERGVVTIEEIPELDLAIVRLPERIDARLAPRFVRERESIAHPMAIHNRTDCLRTLIIQGQSYELRYRYESWVQLISRRPLPRVDLTPLCEELTGREGPGGAWEFDGVNRLTSAMRLVGAETSRVAPEDFVARVEAFLRAGEPAWDPYDPE